MKFRVMKKLTKDFKTWEYYKDKDLLMRKQSLKEKIYRLIFGIINISVEIWMIAIILLLIIFGYLDHYYFHLFTYVPGS